LQRKDVKPQRFSTTYCPDFHGWGGEFQQAPQIGTLRVVELLLAQRRRLCHIPGEAKPLQIALDMLIVENLMNYTIFLWFGAVIAFLVGQIYFLGRRMSDPEKMIRSAELTPQRQIVIDGYREWLALQQLEHRKTFQFASIVVVVFQHKDHPRYFSFMFHQRLSWCMESYLEDLTILDTSNSGSPELFPRPGAFRQNFPGVSVEEIWQRHLQGEEHLSKKFGYRWVPINRPYEELLSSAMRIRMSHIRSQLLWPFWVLYRYFMTGRRFKRTIEEQFPL
jgi:hypothetical protein